MSEDNKEYLDEINNVSDEEEEVEVDEREVEKMDDFPPPSIFDKIRRVGRKREPVFDDLNLSEIGSHESQMPPIYNGNMVLVLNESAGVLTPFQVNPDHTGSYALGGEARTIEIPQDGMAKQMYIDLSMFLGSGIWFRFRWFWLMLCAKCLLLRVYFSYMFNMYGAQSVGEYTIDLHADETPEDLRMRFEAQIKLKNSTLKADIMGMLLQGSSPRSDAMKWFLYVLIENVLIIAAFLLLMSQYNMIKA